MVDMDVVSPVPVCGGILGAQGDVPAVQHGKPRRAGRPNCTESYGKEPDFQPNFSSYLRTMTDWPSEAEFCGNNAGNHGGHVGFAVLCPASAHLSRIKRAPIVGVTMREKQALAAEPP
jgi:hypothetical protein